MKPLWICGVSAFYVLLIPPMHAIFRMTDRLLDRECGDADWGRAWVWPVYLIIVFLFIGLFALFTFFTKGSEGLESELREALFGERPDSVPSQTHGVVAKP